MSYQPCTALAPLTWPELLALVPELADLSADARLVAFTVAGDAHFCRHDCYALGYRAFPSFKRRLNQLVGFHCDHADERVRTSAAWDLGLEHLLAALPACRRCTCIGRYGMLRCDPDSVGPLSVPKLAGGLTHLW
ncbi:MAG: hypothetical protein JNM56_05995 [Planctomycetia bacterium]|nr:hypothetical protein [Planctomycetia bacterium]